MRIPLVLFAFVPLLLCYCPDAEEREREGKVDKENHGCRTCPPIATSADEKCPIGFECDPSWQLTNNVLSPNDCATCSELSCADRNATLAVDGEKVGKIRCNSEEWTLPRNPSTTVTTAVCAKSCGKGVCIPKHPKITSLDYSSLKVKGPDDEENCAHAECSKGIAIFNDDGEFKELLTGTSLVCSSSGKWKIGGNEERYAMCRECSCKKTDEKLTDGSKGACPDGRLCVPPKDGDECALTCPEKSSPMFVDGEGTPQSSDDIKCVRGDWIVAGAKEITCAYESGKGYSDTPTAPCTSLSEFTCPPELNCVYDPIVYTPYKDGSRVTCRVGALITDQTGPGEILVVDCVAGKWEYNGKTISKANCAGDKETGVACTNLVNPGPDSVKFVCELAACTLTCVEPAKKFQYDLPGGRKGIKANSVKCLAAQLRSADLQPIDNVACV